MTTEINFWNDWKQDQANSYNSRTKHSKGEEMSEALEPQQVEQEVCPKCFGAGNLTFNSDDGWFNTCPICHGTGKVPKADSEADRDIKEGNVETFHSSTEVIKYLHSDPKQREEVAILLHGWLHSSGSPAWESKKTPEVVRVGYRKRADQIIAMIEGEKE